MKRSLTKKTIKWFSILVILGMLIFLILTFSKTFGFTLKDKWTTNSGSSIISSSITSSGPGPLQKHTMQVLIALLGGGSLGLAGALLQKVTKNRLAEVSILGIGSLNIFFIYLYAILLKDKAFGNGIMGLLMPVFLIIVSIIGTLFVWGISRSRKANKNTFVIVGIALQLLIEGLSVIIVNPNKLTSTKEGKEVWNRIKGYTLGKIRADIKNTTSKADSNPVQWWLIFLVIGIIGVVMLLIFFLRRKIDTFETSELLSISTGIKANHLKLIMYILVALLAGAASAILGTVALLGIIAPSVARLLFKNRMMPLAISSFLIGGIMVLAASWISLELNAPVAVGILSTAIVIPYFIFLMIKEK